jgi:hypothetical protein
MVYFDYSGIIHFHSDYSFDGRTPLPAIISAAHDNGLDFLMLTDHSTLRAKEEGYEGWHGKTLLIVGQEIAPRFNHLLIFDTDTPIHVDKDDEGIDPQSYLNAVQEEGGICFLAHPDHEGTALFHVKHYPWLNWNVDGYTGIGVWDFMTDWQNSLRGYFRAVLSYFFPGFFLQGPQPATLERWDRLNRTRRVVGIGECDNHDTLKRFLKISLSVFPFRKAFRFVRTHVLTRTPFTADHHRDKDLVFQALRDGHVYIAQEYFHKARGFFFAVKEGDREGIMGDIFLLDHKALLSVSIPSIGHIRVVKDGSLFHEEIGHSASCSICQPGIYRIEVFAKCYGRYRPWIFSNPVYVNQLQT